MFVFLFVFIQGVADTVFPRLEEMDAVFCYYNSSGHGKPVSYNGLRQVRLISFWWGSSSRIWFCMVYLTGDQYLPSTYSWDSNGSFPNFASVTFSSLGQNLLKLQRNPPQFVSLSTLYYKFTSTLLLAFNSFQIRFKFVSHLLQIRFKFGPNSLHIHLKFISKFTSNFRSIRRKNFCRSLF